MRLVGYDFGSTAAHEIGHVFGLAHPEVIDDRWHRNDDHPAARYANCPPVVVSDNAATMCAGLRTYFPWGRTLLWYDADSLDALWEQMY